MNSKLTERKKVRNVRGYSALQITKEMQANKPTHQQKLKY